MFTTNLVMSKPGVISRENARERRSHVHSQIFFRS